MVRRGLPREKLEAIERARADARRKRVEAGLPEVADDGPAIAKVRPTKKKSKAAS